MATTTSSNPNPTTSTKQSQSHRANTTSSSSSRSHNPTHKESDLPSFRLMAVSQASLPPIPNEPKFNPPALAPDYMYALRTTTLEGNHKFRALHPPPDIDLHDMSRPESEYQTRTIRLPHSDERLLRRDAHAKSTSIVKHPLTNKEKTWLLKTVFLNVAPFAMQRQAERARERSGKAYDELSRLDKIEKQFEDTINNVLPPPPKPNAQVKRIVPFLPTRNLSSIELLHLKFPANESLGLDKNAHTSDDDGDDDDWLISRSLLVKRPVSSKNKSGSNNNKRGSRKNAAAVSELLQKNEYDPLCMYVPKRLRSIEEEDDIFAADDDDQKGPEIQQSKSHVYDTSQATFARDYSVRVSNERSQRMVMVFKPDVVEYAVIQPQVLMLTRSYHADVSTLEEVEVHHRELTEQEIQDRLNKGIVGEAGMDDEQQQQDNNNIGGNSNVDGGNVEKDQMNNSTHNEEETKMIVE
jgi:hypothetical protein